MIPTGYHSDGSRFIMATSAKAPKVRALSAHPHVALTIDTVTFPPKVLMVRGTAQLEVVEGGPPGYLEASKKQISADQWQTFQAQVRQTYRQMVKISVTPEWARVFDFVTRAPPVTQG